MFEPPAVFDARPPPEPITARPSARRVVRWCEVRAVLERKCQRCHTTPSQVGAPFPLLAFDDTRREYPPTSGQRVFERLRHVIRHRVMPPTAMPLEPEVVPLTQDEADVLLVWLEEGALPLGGTECAPSAAH